MRIYLVARLKLKSIAEEYIAFTEKGKYRYLTEEMVQLKLESGLILNSHFNLIAGTFELPKVLATVDSNCRAYIKGCEINDIVVYHKEEKVHYSCLEYITGNVISSSNNKKLIIADFDIIAYEEELTHQKVYYANKLGHTTEQNHKLKDILDVVSDTTMYEELTEYADGYKLNKLGETTERTLIIPKHITALGIKSIEHEQLDKLGADNIKYMESLCISTSYIKNLNLNRIEYTEPESIACSTIENLTISSENIKYLSPRTLWPKTRVITLRLESSFFEKHPGITIELLKNVEIQYEVYVSKGLYNILKYMDIYGVKAISEKSDI